MVLARYDCSPDALIAAVRRFRDKNILVIGDLMLDRFIWGSVRRISPEAPVPVVEIHTESLCPGGAANVAANIRSLGARPVPVGLVGDDEEGTRLREMLAGLDAAAGGLIVQRGRKTTVKTRIIAHHQQVCRTDRECKEPISQRTRESAVRRFRACLRRADAVVVSDYAKGMISPDLLEEILPLARAAGRVVCVDPKMRDLSVYRPATVITPNTLEAEAASGISIQSETDLIRAGRKILRQSGAEHLLVTRGEEGMALFEGRARVTCIPTLAREVYDVTGAGDTVISTLALGLASGISPLEAAVLANIAAGIVVAKLGTSSVSPEELIAGIRRSAGRDEPAPLDPRRPASAKRAAP